LERHTDVGLGAGQSVVAFLFIVCNFWVIFVARLAKLVVMNDLPLYGTRQGTLLSIASLSPE
jgi:hypothetical protein